MNRYTFLIIIILISLTILTKLVQISKPIVVTDKSNSLTLGWRQKSSQENDPQKTTTTEKFYLKDTSKTTFLKTRGDLSARKLRKYAQAFVKVQSYMERAGSNANYSDTTKIVNSYGLSVGDYTLISTQMNKSPLFREEVQKLIHEIQ